MPKTLNLILKESALSLFGDDKQKRGGGWNVRIRFHNERIYFKPSSRLDCVLGEMFAKVDPKTGTGKFESLSDSIIGSFSYMSDKRGWYVLIPNEKGTINFSEVDVSSKIEPIAVQEKEEKPEIQEIEDENSESSEESNHYQIIPPTGCSWPIGDVGSKDFHFCDGKVKQSPHCSSYCAKHLQEAYSH